MQYRRSDPERMMTFMLMHSKGIRLVFILVLFLLMMVMLLAAASARAQEIVEESGISADRPGQAVSPSVVRPGDVQIETGIMLQRDAPASNVSIITLRYPTTLLRIGILPTMELRVTGEYLDERTQPAGNRTGINAPTVGTKIAIAEEKGALPELGFVAQLGLPIGNDALKPEFTAPTIMLAMRNAIGERFNLYYNIIGSWNGLDAAAAGGYAVLLSISTTSDFSGFVEFYGTFSPINTPSHAANAGISWLLLPNLQLDLSGGIGITDNAPDYFVSVGVSLRLPR